MLRLAPWVVLAACQTRATTPMTRVDPGAQPLLDAWAAARGGRERLAALHAVHVRGTITIDGAIAQTEQWTTDRGEMRDETNDHGVTSMDVFDGERAWSVDASGLAVERTGTALEQTRSGAFLASESALIVDRRAGAVERVDDHTLRLTADGSSFPITVELDPTTYLPARIRRVVGGAELTTTLRDWREVDGVQYAFASRTVGDDTEDEQVTALDHATSRFAATPGRTDLLRLSGPSPLELPLEIAASSRLVVRVQVNGSAPRGFILDTGAPTIVDPARLPGVAFGHVGASQIMGQGGIGEVAYAPGVTFAFPGAALGPYTVRTTSIAAMWPDVDASIAGLLGAELFQTAVLQIDYPAQVLRIFDPATYTHPSQGLALPFELFERSPVVHADLVLGPGAPVTGAFEIDTGCQCDLVLNAPFAAANHVASEPAALLLGARRVDHPKVNVGPATTRLFQNRDLAGMIGGRLLRRYVVTIDYRAHTVWLDEPALSRSDR